MIKCRFMCYGGRGRGCYLLVDNAAIVNNRGTYIMNMIEYRCVWSVCHLFGRCDRCNHVIAGSTKLKPPQPKETRRSHHPRNYMLSATSRKQRNNQFRVACPWQFSLIFQNGPYFCRPFLTSSANEYTSMWSWWCRHHLFSSPPHVSTRFSPRVPCEFKVWKKGSLNTKHVE